MRANKKFVHLRLGLIEKVLLVLVWYTVIQIFIFPVDRASANTTGQFIILYAQNCPLAGNRATYTDIGAVTKDTIPQEWWPANLLGVSTIPYSALQTASVIIRSRIIFENLYAPETSEDFTSANLDTRGSINSSWNKTNYPLCNTYTMNTVVGAGNTYGNSSTYQSNNATNSTSGHNIVNIAGNLNVLIEFHAGQDKVQWRSTNCAEQSDNWKFCSVSSLAAELIPNNRYARRLSTEPTDKIKFEAEAFFTRAATATHAWLCQNDPSHWGYYNKCYMRASPNNGTGYASNEGYITNSPVMNYYVAFPETNGTIWYIWARGKGCGPSNDSIHIGLNSIQTPTAEDMTGWDSCTAGINGFVWASVRVNGSRPYIVAATDNNNVAYKVVNLWMREDGMRVDRIVLVRDANFNPINDAWANGN